MDFILDIVLDAAKDSLSLVPFLFVTYLLLEALEHTAGERVNMAVKRAGAAGPIVGAVLGVVPQCGFSAMAATLYAGRIITLGTLVAVFLSTSDEMLPMLVAESVPLNQMAQILASKALIALVSGFIIDALIRALRSNEPVHLALRRTIFGKAAGEGEDILDEFSEGGEGASHIHELCEREHCGCDDEHAEHEHEHAEHNSHGTHDHDVHAHTHSHDHGHDHAHSHDGHSALGHIVRSALKHTIQVSVFIFLVTLALVALLETVGEPAMESFLKSNEAIAVLGSALVGLVPNCSASVVITQLYLEGVLSFGPMMAGTLVSAGVGYLVLFRTNESVRQNVVILAMLYVVGILWGFTLTAFGF